MKVYLSYPIQYLTDRTKIENYINCICSELDRLHIDYFSPLKEESIMIQDFGAARFDQLDEAKKISAMTYMREYECLEVENSDCVIGIFDDIITPSAGSSGELTLAAWNNIPVVLLIDPKIEDQMSIWIKSCADKICYTTEDVLNYVRSI